MVKARYACCQQCTAMNNNVRCNILLRQRSQCKPAVLGANSTLSKPRVRGEQKPHISCNRRWAAWLHDFVPALGQPASMALQLAAPGAPDWSFSAVVSDVACG